MNMKYLLIAGVLMSHVVIAEEAELANPVTENGVVKIEWQDPKSYHDLKTSNEIQSRFENRFFETITKNLNKEAEKTLKPNQKLVMQVSDVDLAGDMRPTFGATMGDLRVVKDLYPPRMTFTYQILEGEQVVVAGDEKLLDMNFMSNIRRINERPFDAETNMLKHWLHKTVEPQLKDTVAH